MSVTTKLKELKLNIYDTLQKWTQQQSTAGHDELHFTPLANVAESGDATDLKEVEDTDKGKFLHANESTGKVEWSTVPLPSEYLKNASVSGNDLTLTKQDDTTVDFGYTEGTGIDITDRVVSLDIHDYIIESGTSNGWTYRKWNSGKAEAWYAQLGLSIYCGNAWGGMYESTLQSRPTLPSGFSVSYTNATLTNTTTSNCAMTINLRNNGSGFALARPNAYTVNVGVYWYIVGTMS